MKLNFIKKIKNFKSALYLINKYKSYAKSHDKRYVIFGAPLHGNIGDHAICIAEQKFLKDNGIVTFEIPGYYRYMKLIIHGIIKYVNKNDIIFVRGGGSMGTEYFLTEKMIRTIIKKFPNNKIIVMPQTIFYSNDKFSQKEFKKSKEIYNAHKSLYICARENVSYNIMKEAYPNAKILLIPDIVLYLNETKKEERDGILFVIRKDLEKKVSKEEMNRIIEIAKRIEKNVSITDTALEREIAIEERDEILQKKLDEFRKSKLVITDRLHGMILSTITATPCIAFNNYNHKIRASYNWVKNLNYISFIDDNKNIEEEIKKLLKLKNIKFENEDLKQYYNKILECIEE